MSLLYLNSRLISYKKLELYRYLIYAVYIVTVCCLVLISNFILSNLIKKGIFILIFPKVFKPSKTLNATSIQQFLSSFVKAGTTSIRINMANKFFSYNTSYYSIPTNLVHFLLL